MLSPLTTMLVTANRTFQRLLPITSSSFTQERNVVGEILWLDVALPTAIPTELEMMLPTCPTLDIMI